MPRKRALRSLQVSRAESPIISYFRFLLRVFFSRIEVVGLENIPEDRGGLIVSWHPNGVIDGALILTHFPQRMVIGARHGLFRWPVLGWLMRRIGAVPIYRRRDMRQGESNSGRRASNRRSVDLLAQAVARGGFAALFPEGRSHDEPCVQELKTGAAHLYLRAADLIPERSALPAILPVGLHYSRKTIFGSQVLLAFHPPIQLPIELAEPASNDEERRRQARELTVEIDCVLREVVLATESWELHHLFQRARKLIRAEGMARSGTKSKPPDMTERIRHFASIWRGYRKGLRSHTAATVKLVADVASYDDEMRALRIEDHELDGTPWVSSPSRAFLLLLEFLLVYLVLPPFLLIGVLVNLAPTLLVVGVTKTVSEEYKDEASVKLLLGSVVFPLTWLLMAVLVGWSERTLAGVYPEIPEAPVLTGVVAFLLSAFGGLLALQYRQIATETMRTVRVHLTLARRRRTVQQLLQKRSDLFDQFLTLGRELESTPLG